MPHAGSAAKHGRAPRAWGRPRKAADRQTAEDGAPPRRRSTFRDCGIVRAVGIDCRLRAILACRRCR